MRLRLFAYLPFALHFVQCVLHKWGAEPTPSPVDTVGSELHLEIGALSVSPRADFPQSYDLGHVSICRLTDTAIRWLTSILPS